MYRLELFKHAHLLTRADLPSVALTNATEGCLLAAALGSKASCLALELSHVQSTKRADVGEQIENGSEKGVLERMGSFLKEIVEVKQRGVKMQRSRLASAGCVRAAAAVLGGVPMDMAAATVARGGLREGLLADVKDETAGLAKQAVKLLEDSGLVADLGDGFGAWALARCCRVRHSGCGFCINIACSMSQRKRQFLRHWYQLHDSVVLH
jgi:hypothetical protein